METDYIVGIDCAKSKESKSESAITVVRKVGNNFEIIKVLSWYQKWNWWNKLKFRFTVWKIYWKYFRGKATILKETNKPNKATSYFNLK